MGTSKGYKPPSDQGSQWHSLSIQMGKLLSEPEKKELVLEKFIGAIGGAENFSKSNSTSSGTKTFKSTAARETAQKLGSVFSGFNINGVEETFKSIGLDIVGKSLGELKESLLNYFLITNIDADTYASTKAIATVIDELFLDIETEDDLERKFSTLITSDDKKLIVCGFYQNYIYELFARTFFEKWSEKKGLEESLEILELMKNTIDSKVRKFDCSKDIQSIDFSSEAGALFVQGILNEMLELMETIDV